MTDHTSDSDLLSLRREKIEKLRALGVEPYAYQSRQSHSVKTLLDQFESMERSATVVTLAGRIRSWRPHGGSIFFHVEESTGRLQCYAKRDVLGESAFEILSLLDIGDFVEVSGTLFVTKMGEQTLAAQTVRVLSKSIRPLPSEWYGLKDSEVRFRQRYLDFLMNPEVKTKVEKRAKMIWEIRQFLGERGFLEIDNPLLETVPSGALSKPFKTYINAYEMDIYLRICISELWQKRSIIGGFEKVFEIGKAFRNEGVSFQHNPEFTMLEYYWAYGTLEENMLLHEALFERLAQVICGGLKFEHDGKQIDFTPPYPRKTFRQAIIDAVEIDIEAYPDKASLISLLRSREIEYNPNDSYGQLLDELFKHTARPLLHQPTFITEYPVQLKPLAKKVHGREQYSDVFQLLIAGMEVSNSYNELNDPTEQRKRFEEQAGFTADGSEEAMRVDHDYIKALEYGMPPTTGTGIGIDRLAALLTNSHHLREVITYPIMKPEQPIAQEKQEERPVESCTLPLSPSDDSLLSIDPVVRQQFPDLKVGMAVIDGITVEQANAAFSMLQSQIQPKLATVTQEQWRDSARLNAYRTLYKQFGVDPNSKRPSADALLHRISRGKGMYSVNTVVDTYNLFSAEHALCMAAYDADTVQGALILRLSQPGDTISLIGDTSPTAIEPGKLVYADQAGVTCLYFNYRDADRTKVTESTRRLLFFVDGCGQITEAEVELALRETAQALVTVCGGRVTRLSVASASAGATEATNIGASDSLSRQDIGIDRAEALALMESMIENINLRKHALAVEAALRFYARQLGENEELWGITGLLHDADWEKHPDEHPSVIVEQLKARGVNPAIPQAIACHGLHWGIPQVSLLDKYLFACDELTGMITATALVRPDKSLASVTVESVKKKMKDKGFAKGVSREDVEYGRSLIGLDLDLHIQNVLTAMQAIAPTLGL